jgi:hypothetical protein
MDYNEDINQTHHMKNKPNMLIESSWQRKSETLGK